MKETVEFNFGDDAIAKAYDTILVPSLFEDWAKQLILDYRPWKGLHVLDLACGTGVVTNELADSICIEGKVTALDMNIQMLNQAKAKCQQYSNIEFIVGTADALDLHDNSMDKVVCQQGFQFFPDKKVAAQEIYRVLKPSGEVIVSTWCSVSECDIFDITCRVLESMDLHEISKMMRMPFDLLTQKGLSEAFEGIGFSNIECSVQEKKLFLPTDKALTFIYATPIGPKLNALGNDKETTFKKSFMELLQKENLIQEDGSIGRMTTNIIHLKK